MKCSVRSVWLIVIFMMALLMQVTDVRADQHADQSEEYQQMFARWHGANLRWFVLGDNLIFIFPADVFYTTYKNKVVLHQQVILTEVATWLQSIPKTWVRVLGFRQRSPNIKRDRQLAHQDADALAQYFWDHGIDARGIYTAGVAEPSTSYDAQGQAERIEMVISLLPTDTRLN